MPAHETHQATLPDGRLRVKTAGMPCPGFLTAGSFCSTRRGRHGGRRSGAGGFRPRETASDDRHARGFRGILGAAKAENAKIPMDPRVERAPNSGVRTRLMSTTCVCKVSARTITFMAMFRSPSRRDRIRPCSMFPGQALRKPSPRPTMAEKGGDHDDPSASTAFRSTCPTRITTS